jgi:hypothetical protein
LPNPKLCSNSNLPAALKDYLKSAIPSEVSKIVDEMAHLHSQHSAFSQLALNRAVQHCCGLLNVPYGSHSNQATKCETPHRKSVSINDIIYYFNKQKPTTFGNHRGTHLKALITVKLLDTHEDVLEGKDAKFLKCLKDILTCEMSFQTWHDLDRSSLGLINSLKDWLKGILQKYNS